MPTKLTHAQAEEQLMDGCTIITNGAYTYVHDDERGNHYYTAFGTYPGCWRGGAAPKFTDKHWLDNSWSRLSSIEIIIRNGWFPSDVGNATAYAIRACERAGGHAVPDFDDMIVYALDNGTSSKLLKDPMTSGLYWKEYFVKKGLHQLLPQAVVDAVRDSPERRVRVKSNWVGLTIVGEIGLELVQDGSLKYHLVFDEQCASVGPFYFIAKDPSGLVVTQVPSEDNHFMFATTRDLLAQTAWSKLWAKRNIIEALEVLVENENA